MATVAVRTLPLRVAPVAGEAIDSWLEATAHRCSVTWAELRAALGPVLPATVYPDEWIGRLTDLKISRWPEYAHDGC